MLNIILSEIMFVSFRIYKGIRSQMSELPEVESDRPHTVIWSPNSTSEKFLFDFSVKRTLNVILSMKPDAKVIFKK